MKPATLAIQFVQLGFILLVLMYLANSMAAKVADAIAAGVCVGIGVALFLKDLKP